jgi:hypothetical protein
LRTTRVVLAVLALSGCGGSPLAPTEPSGIAISGFEVQTTENFSGSRPYFVCGDIRRAAGIVDEIRLQTLDVKLLDVSGREYVTHQLALSQGPLFSNSGCFGIATDPIPGRAVASSYRLTFTYTQAGRTRSLDFSGTNVVSR